MLKGTWLTFVRADVMVNSLIWDTPILAISPLIKRTASSQGWPLHPAVLQSFFYDRPLKRTLSKTGRPSARPEVSMTVLLVNRNAILFFQLTVSSVRVSELADWAYFFVGLHYGTYRSVLKDLFEVARGSGSYSSKQSQTPQSIIRHSIGPNLRAGSLVVLRKSLSSRGSSREITRPHWGERSWSEWAEC